MSTVTPDAVPAGQPSERDASRPVPSRPHFPCLEGLRALAACMVVFHHSVNAAMPKWSPDLVPLAGTPLVARFGHVMDGGVGVFFVLSGFLIYRPFVAGHLAGRPPMQARRFLWRRLLRIVPAFWLVLTFFWVLGNYDLGSPAEAIRYYAFGQVYDPYTAVNGIFPAWSLNVEVTFYLFIPVYAWLVGKLARGRWVMVTEAGGVAALILLGYAFRAAVSDQDQFWWRDISFAWLPANIDLFAAGMAVAVLSAWAAQRTERPRWVDQLGRSPELCWVLAISLFSWYAVRIGPTKFDVGYRGGYWQLRQATLALFALLLLVPAVFGRQDRGPVRRALQLRPVVWVGLVSYGLYLWHLPWLDRLQTQQNRISGQIEFRGWIDGPVSLPTALAVAFGLGLFCASLSWYLLEKPLQRFKSVV